VVAKQLENKLSWKKGQSGNPKGRAPSGQTLTDEIRKLLDLQDVEIKQGNLKIKITRKEAIAQVIVRKCINGDSSTLKLLYSYIDGVPIQRLEHTGEGGEPIEVVFPQGFKGV